MAIIDISKFKDLNKADIIRKAIYGLVSVKNYDLIKDKGIIVKNIENIDGAKIFNIGKKYQFLDKIFLRVLEKHPEKMPKIFFNMFKTSSNTIIKFLSNKSNIIEDINIISKMPKLIFLKALFN